MRAPVRESMKNELKSGVHSTLRALCDSCRKAIVDHAFCSACCRPRRCGEDDDWESEGESLRCPTCVFARAV